ncbi:GDP-mannose 4,6-dehydratase [Cellulomonas soli]
MTRVFITGVAGQDGSLLAGRLASDGAQVHGLVRTSADAAEAAPRLPAGVTLHVGDLLDTAAVERIIAEVAPTEVYNLAGVSSVAQSWVDPVVTGMVSGVGAVAVFEAAWRLQERTGNPVRVLQASSAEIFGQAEISPQDERTPLRPTSPYGAAKAYAHHMASIYRGRGLPVSTCVLYNHESPSRPTAFVTRKITSTVARIAHEGRGHLTLGRTDVRRDWGWAPDYVDAMVRAVRHESADDYVVATGEVHTVAEFVEVAMRHAGIEDWESHLRIDETLVRPADAAEQVGDPSKARRVLGWAPTVDFAGIVARMVDHDLELLRSRP